MEAHTYKQLVVDRSVVILRVIESAVYVVFVVLIMELEQSPGCRNCLKLYAIKGMVYKPISGGRCVTCSGGSNDYVHSDSCLFTLKWMFMAALKCNSADNRHLPLLLACSHSFCSSCLAVMGRAQKYSGHIKCPECKVSIVRGVTVTEVGLNNTQPNYAEWLAVNNCNTL